MANIQFEHVSKRFTLHRQRSRSFQELFLNQLRPGRRPAREEFWALRDVSFHVEPGEMLGIIGANGAGKSTILKLLTRIIEPTSGTVAVGGRVAALLELGTGFHPELTGRENIYLNGSFVGFRKAQIDRLMDDIIGFSEMERFIDVPVKHYSSGMYMRLGFSIAIHIEPDILLVDEVLAVGDQAFQLRCLDRIQELKRQGVTIILVTHILDRVRELCDRALWLDDGLIRQEGVAEQVLKAYLAQVQADDKLALDRAESALRSRGPSGSPWRWGSKKAEITAVHLLDGTGHEGRTFTTGETLTVRIHFSAPERIERPLFGIAIHHAGGCHINGPNTASAGLDIEGIHGDGYVDYTVDSLPLLPGTYLVSASLYDREGNLAYDFHHQAYTFRVSPNKAIAERYGCVLIPSWWAKGSTGFCPTTESEQAREPQPGSAL